MRWPWSKRAVEATPTQLAVSGAAGGQYAQDPVDGDFGWQRLGGGEREVPSWTLEKQRAYSVAAYRLNPMARAIIDTYTSFAVGDSGLSVQCTNDAVRAVVMEFWNDPRNQLASIQDLLLRDHMLMGESAYEMMVGPISGVCRYSPISTLRVSGVRLHGGNPLWPSELLITSPGEDDLPLPVVGIDDLTGLRTGQVQWWPSWKATLQDRRGQPFLGPVLDWLDDFDAILSNLVDRTALMRYLSMDVTLDGADDDDIKKFLKERGSRQIPKSGTIEVHNDKVHWEPKTASVGAMEDDVASKMVLTSIAAGTGLAKHWLADPDNANRATALTMAEPVLRRVAGVQNLWLSYMTEFVRYPVDQAVRAGRLPRMVAATDNRTAAETEVPAAQTVTVTGPEIAVQEQVATADTLLKLAQALQAMVADKFLSPEAAQVLSKKAWEQYAGVPYTAELDTPDADVNDVAQAIDDATTSGTDTKAIPPVPAAL